MGGPIEGRVPATCATGDPVYGSTQGRQALSRTHNDGLHAFAVESFGKRKEGEALVG
jgi:hypothetical protein